MKIGIVGAYGKQGRMLVKEAKNRGHNVTAFVHKTKHDSVCVDKTVIKDLFSLNSDDIKNLDVLISAFGSGFDADPAINHSAAKHLISLGEQSGTRILFVGGAGSLYTNSSHIKRVYEQADHPKFLYEISKNMTLGYEEMLKSKSLKWTYVCPSLKFDYEGEKTGKYIIGTNEVLYNDMGESEISYADYAMAMIDEAENVAYPNQMITVCKK